MAELLILDFDGVVEADYLEVNRELGLDPKTGAGDWPAGLITHVLPCGSRRPREGNPVPEAMRPLMPHCALGDARYCRRGQASG